MMMLHVDLQICGISELLGDPGVALPADLTVIEVGLRGIGTDHHDSVELDPPVTGSDHLFEVDVADVARVVVAGHGHHARAQLLEVCGGRRVLLAESFVGEVAGTNDQVGRHLVELGHDTVHQIRYEVDRPHVQVRDVRDPDAHYSSMTTRTDPSLLSMEKLVVSPSRRKTRCNVESPTRRFLNSTVLSHGGRTGELIVNRFSWARAESPSIACSNRNGEPAAHACGEQATG